MVGLFQPRASKLVLSPIFQYSINGLHTGGGQAIAIFYSMLDLFLSKLGLDNALYRYSIMHYTVSSSLFLT